MENENKKTETFDNQTVTVVKPQEKKKNSKVIMIITTILLVLVATLGIYTMIKKNTKMAFVHSLDMLEDSLEGYVANFEIDNNIPFNGKYTEKGTMTMNIASDLLSEDMITEETAMYATILKNMGNMNFSYETQTDKEAKKMFVNMIGTLKKEELLNVKYVMDQNKHYIYLKDVLDKYLDLETDVDIFETVEKESNEEDFEYIVETIQKSLKKNIKDSYVKKEESTITINQKETKVQKVMLVLDGKNAKELLTNIVKNIKADRKANDIITKVYPEFKDYQVEIDETQKGIRYNVYVKGLNDVVKVELVSDKSTISYTKDTKDIIELTDDGKIIGKVEIAKEKNKLTVEVKDSTGKVMATVTLTQTGKDKNTTTAITADVEGLVVKAELTQKTTKKNEKEYNVNKEITLQATADGMNMVNATIKNEATMTEGANITEKVTDAMTKEQLTEEQQEKMQTWLYNILMKLMQ